MAPRRVFVPKKSSEVFHRLLRQRLEDSRQKNWATHVSAQTYHQLWEGVEDAVRKGARVFSGGPRAAMSSPVENSGSVSCGHLVLTEVTTEMRLCSADIFAPLAMIIPVDDWSDALRADSRCPYALSASNFGPIEDALRLVRFVSAGFVSINDLIVPTADPRLPFGGRGESGFGVTRGNEGLLEMTFPKVVSTRLGSWLPHAKLPEPSDEELLDGLLQFSHHNRIKVRMQGLVQTVRAAMSQRKSNKGNEQVSPESKSTLNETNSKMRIS